MKITKATITGADDTVEMKNLLPLIERFPFSEWGILVSANGEGKSRFPSRAWIRDFLSELPPSANVCVHLCGRWVRDLLHDGKLDFRDGYDGLMRELYGRAQRIQLNFHAITHEAGERFPEALDEIMAGDGKAVIFQLDDVNDDLYYQHASPFVHPLFDRSGGAGVEFPWKRINALYAGYAGGLKPSELPAQLDRIAAAVGEQTVWVDIETHVRVHEELRPELCEEYLKAVEERIAR